MAIRGQGMASSSAETVPGGSCPMRAGGARARRSRRGRGRSAGCRTGAPCRRPDGEAHKASATAAGACRTRSAACSASASCSTRWRARPPPRPARAAPASAGRISQASSLSIGAARLVELRQQHASSASGSRAMRAQHVQADDVARTLPDRVDRRLAVEPRQDRFLDVAVAAEAFERLGDDRRRALADPVLGDRASRGGRSPPPPRRLGAAVEGARQRASPGRSRPRLRARGRPARCASAAGRSAACRRRCGGRRDAAPGPPPGASAPPS